MKYNLIMIVQIVLTIVLYFVLMYLSVNLLGFLVRGLFTNPEFERLKKEGHDFIKQEVKKSESLDKWINLVALILIVGYFYGLFRIWNMGVVVVALVIMAGRLPDLIWEIKHGRKTDSKLMNKNAMYYISAFLPWLALPLLFYSLYYL